MEVPARDYSLVLDEQDNIDILHSPFFDVGFDYDHTVEEYLDRITLPWWIRSTIKGRKDSGPSCGRLRPFPLQLLPHSKTTSLNYYDSSPIPSAFKWMLSDDDSFRLRDLFLCLYSSWCHSPMGMISLCLLAQAYHHASAVIQSLGEEDINVKFLMQLDKLIRLLEAPIFTYLRLQVCESLVIFCFELHDFLRNCLSSIYLNMKMQPLECYALSGIEILLENLTSSS
ncbi:hypothetical protein IEQ34_003739 [Dendrobium chrysotoxum]|uniref:Vacuolar protein 14 C-terminal Fig4-binding domain-containing protein n=1 Tax=Dendrobium chrysotoxum TaxID=161865 RepID=A0AAV7HBW4_DENCH|nr:hypothetical protein IEQ34_003739 [Dendrobium chrysotoxum]